MRTHRTTCAPRDPRYSIAYACAADASEYVQIHRTLGGENGPDGAEAWDPIVNVWFKEPRWPNLHPGDQPAELGDGWLSIRWSEVNDLIEALLDARDAAIRTGTLPVPLSDSERMARTDQRDVEAGKVPGWGPRAVQHVRRLEREAQRTA